MQFKYIAAFIASLAVNGALAIPVPDAAAMNAALEDAALQARAEQIEQAGQLWDDDFFDWDKAKVMRRAEQIEQAGQFWDDDFDKAKVMKRAEQVQQARQGNQWFGWPSVGFRAGFNFNNRFLFQQQNPWLWQNQLWGRQGWWGW